MIKNNQQKILKGFVFCRANLNRELVQFFYNIREVKGFLNQPNEISKLPNCVSEELVEKLSKQAHSEQKKVASDNYSPTDLKVNDLVQISLGSSIYEGKVTHIDEKKQKVSVSIDFMGKKTIIDNVPINTVIPQFK